MLVARGQITIWACQDGESMTLRGQWRRGTVTPYLGVVRMGRAVFACNVRAGSANPPMWCYTDAQGNYYTYADGGYVLTGEMNTAEYVLIAEDGYDGTDGIDGTNGKDGTSIIWKGSFAAHPENPQNGWAYKNTADKKSYIYQDGAWYQMTIDGIDGKNGNPGKDGIGITWKGDSATPPVNPQMNWVYRDTNNGKVYIYNGTAWSLMVVDGSDGKPGAKGDNGLSVFITYHDSITTPAKPTGDGSSGGWHHNTTAATKWMSQKVAASVSVGTWGNPILIKGDKGDKGNKGDKGDKGDSITISGEWRSGTTTPYLGVVRMCGNSFICINPKGSTAAPYCIFTDNLGNCFTYADGGYVLTGEMNTTDYQLMTESGRDGCIIRKSRWVSGVEYHNDAQINTQIRYLDIALLENDAMSTGYIPYRCKKTHVASAANKPTSGGNEWWEEVTNNDIIYTDFFIAKNASIDLFQGNELLIKDNADNVVAGLTGGNGKLTGVTDVRIWAGSPVPGNAPFRVLSDGSVYGSNMHISGNSTFGGTLDAVTGTFNELQAYGIKQATGQYGVTGAISLKSTHAYDGIELCGRLIYLDSADTFDKQCTLQTKDVIVNGAFSAGARSMIIVGENTIGFYYDSDGLGYLILSNARDKKPHNSSVALPCWSEENEGFSNIIDTIVFTNELPEPYPFSIAMNFGQRVKIIVLNPSCSIEIFTNGGKKTKIQGGSVCDLICLNNKEVLNPYPSTFDGIGIFVSRTSLLQ